MVAPCSPTLIGASQTIRRLERQGKGAPNGRAAVRVLPLAISQLFGRPVHVAKRGAGDVLMGDIAGCGHGFRITP
jgi:hypothetical protein